MTNSEKKTETQSNSGFLFGLTLGAAVGALSAIVVNKSNETEVIKNFESKIKEFFQDLTSEAKTKKEVAKKIEAIDTWGEIEKEEPEKPHIVVKKKSTPKMFVKPKR